MEVTAKHPEHPQGTAAFDSSCDVSSSVVKQVHAAKTISKIEKEAISQDRIPYNNGYGDFCFGKPYRPASFLFGDFTNQRQKRDNMTEAEQKEADGISGSNGVPVPELNGFERTGSFPYFKLPLEIRQRILRLVLRTLFCSCGQANGEHIRFIIERNFEPSLEKCYEGDFENFMQVRLSQAQYRYNEALQVAHKKAYDMENMSGQEIVKAEQEYLKEKKSYDWRRQHHYHPGRSSKEDFYWYDIKVSPPREKAGGKGSYFETDWRFIEWIRQASNVSNIFRKELGDLIWSNAEIIADEQFTPGHIPPILKERPGFWSNIKHLSLYVGVSPTELGILYAACDSIADKLELDFLSLWMSMREEDFSDASLGKREYAQLATTRKVKVKQSFVISDWDITCEDYGYSGSESDSDGFQMAANAYVKKLAKRFEPLFLELMMPDTLRLPKVPPTEMESYLKTREA